MKKVSPLVSTTKWCVLPLLDNPAVAKKRFPRHHCWQDIGYYIRGNTGCVMLVNPIQVKHHSLTGRITSDLVRRSFLNVKRNRGAAGVDKQSITMFEANLEQNLLALLRDLKTRDGFSPQPLRRVLIAKGKGKFRPLGIPVIRDRIAQDVLRQLLEPLFEPLFHPNSFGFRPHRNCHQAVDRVLNIWHEGHRFVLDADISGFFDNIPHQVIMTGLSNVVADGNILGLAEKFLRSGVMEDGVFKPTHIGTPQGGVMTPRTQKATLSLSVK